MVEPPGSRSASRNQSRFGLHTKGKVAELLATLHLITLTLGGENRTNHHGPNTNSHDAAEVWTVDRYDLASVLPVDVQGRSDGLGLHSSDISAEWI
jgi:hypothetical protein